MKGKFERKESRGLPGGPNEQFTYVTGVFSVDGYKADSPDVNNPFNVIPSGNITMKGVDFPVIGTDNLGNTKLMKPGKDYKFPGDMVFEVPMAQFGGMTRKKVDKILDQNKNLNFVQRMYQENTPSMIIPGQKGPSTHFMESSDNIVYPTVVQMPDGTLQYLGDGAYNHAIQTGEYIKLPNEKQAKIFGESYKKGTGVLKDFQKSEMQRGGQMNVEGQKQRNWFDSYIRSDKYLERLGKEMTGFMPGAYDANKVANERRARLMNLRNTPVGFLPESSDISPTPGDVQGVYNADEYPGMIMLRPEYSKGRQGSWSYNTIPLHEMGHAADEGGKRIPQSTKDLLMSTLKDNDLGIPKEEYYYTQPTEYINRLQPFRYLLQEEGIYDASKEDFTEKHLQKAKENTRIELNKHFQDLLRNTKSEKDLINLMNIIAMDERSQGLPTAQFGIEMDSEVPSNIIEQTPDANYFQKLFRPKYYKDLIKSEMKDLDSYGYNKLLKKEYQLEGGTKAERDEINKIIQGRKDRLQGAKFIEDVDYLKSRGALGAYDPKKNAVIYNKAYKNDSNPIDDHEIGHLYDSIKRPGPAFTSKLYDIYKDKNILNPDVIANINNYQPSMTSDQFINEISEKGNKLSFDFEKSLPKFSAVRGGVGDPQSGKIIGYTDKATNQFISNQDLGNYVSENYKDIFADPSNYRELISKYKKYKNSDKEGLSPDEHNQLVEDLKKEMPAFRKYMDEQNKIYDQFNDRLFSGEFDEADARTVEQVKSDLLNNLKIESFNPDIFSKEDDLDDREKNIHNFYVPTEVKARLRAIRKEAEKQGYRKGTDFKGYLDKVKNNSPNVRMQYDQLKQKLNVSDEEINELMLLFAKNNQTNNNLSIAQSGGATTQDSLALYNNAILKAKFYEQNIGDGEFDYKPKRVDRLYQLGFIDDENIEKVFFKNFDPDHVNRRARNLYNTYSYNNGPIKFGSLDDRNKVINKDLIQAGDFLGTHLVDDIYREDAPPVLLHRNIKPDKWKYYSSNGGYDASIVPVYDPVKIYPKSQGPVPKEAYEYSDIEEPKEFSRFVNIHGKEYGFDTTEEFIDIARRKNLPQGWIDANIPKDLEFQTKGLIAKLQTGGDKILTPTYVLPEVTVIGNKKGFDWKNLINNAINPLYKADNALQILDIPANFVRESIEGLSDNGDGEFNWGNIIPNVMNTTILDDDPAQKSVSETLGIDNFLGGLTVDLLTDPATYVGAGVLKNTLVKGGKNVIKNAARSADEVVKATVKDVKPNIKFYHGGLDPKATLDDIDIFKLAKRQNKKNSDYGGFYMSPDLNPNSFALNYANASSSGGLHRIELPPNSKKFTKEGVIERISQKELKKLKDEGYDYIEGKNYFGQPEYVLLNKDKAALYLEKGKEYQTGGEYTVKSGDTFDGIANKKGINKDEFRKANPGISYDNIKINQKLNIPVVEKREPTSWGDYINPYNWGVTDRDDDGSYNQAFRAARNAGEDEFMWYGKRYTTELDKTDVAKEKEPVKKEVSNYSFQEYQDDLKAQENLSLKGWDSKRQLWFPTPAPEKGGGFDIGYGHKIKRGEDFSKGLTNDQVNNLFKRDIDTKFKAAKSTFNNRNLSRSWDELDQQEQILLTDYQYNGVLHDFKKFMKAVADKDKDLMLKEYVRYDDGVPLGKRNDWTKSYIDTNLNYKTGGQLNDLNIYSDYINGNYDDIKFEKEAQKVYDKLNRMHYKNAKQFGMSAPNYIMTYLLKNPNG